MRIHSQSENDIGKKTLQVFLSLTTAVSKARHSNKAIPEHLYLPTSMKTESCQLLCREGVPVT